MLEMKSVCETCAKPIAQDSTAFICSYECTFCAPCADKTHRLTCPNCKGELTQRPKREAA